MLLNFNLLLFSIYFLLLNKNREGYVCMKRLKAGILLAIILVSNVCFGAINYYSNGTTSQDIGNFRYYSDGQVSQTIGQTTYHNHNGQTSTSQQIGNITYHNGPNGMVNSQRIGNITYHSNGQTSQQIGNTVYHSNCGSTVYGR